MALQLSFFLFFFPEPDTRDVTSVRIFDIQFFNIYRAIVIHTVNLLPMVFTRKIFIDISPRM